MATQDNPLLSLAPEKQQQLVDLVESNDIEALATKTGLTRRQILGIGATLAGSGALGGYAATEAIDPAQAQADTGDSDGNVGLPTDRVDVFADGIDSNSLSTDQLISESIPTLVRLFHDETGDVVAISRDSDSVVDSGSDATTVIQSAIDYVYGLRDTSPNNKAYTVAGWIDGGMDTFDVSSNVQLKDQVGLSNMVLDADGASGFTPLTVAGPSTPCYSPGIWSVAVRNSGDSSGVVVDNTAWAFFYNLISSGHATHGAEVLGAVGTTFLRCSFSGNTDDGVLYNGKGGAGNHNHWNICNFAENDTGIRFRMDEAVSNNVTHSNQIWQCNFGQNANRAIIAARNFQSSLIAENWFENTAGEVALGLASDGAVDGNTVRDNTLATGMTINYAIENIIRGNSAQDGAGFDLVFGSPSNNNVAEYNRLGSGTYTDDGTNNTRTTF